MSTLKDIIDTVGGLEGEVANFMVAGKRQKSLSKASLEGVLNFPVVCSDSLAIDDVTLVSRALEKQYASFTLTVMTMNPYLYTMGGAPTASKYVRKFHQNLDTRADTTDLINAVGTFMQEASNRFDIDYESLSEVSDHIFYHVYEGVNHSGMNAKNMKYSYSISDITQSSVLNRTSNKNYKSIKEAKDTPRYFGFKDTDIDIRDNELTTGDINLDIDAKNIDSNQLGRGIGKELGNSMNRSGAFGGTGRQSDPRQFNHTQVSAEFKKANDLVPVLLHMRIFPVNTVTKVELPPIDFVVGIKATLHPVTSEEMIVNVARGIKNQNKFFNFIRWTTGEIRFFKDFLFAMNELKIDAINTSKKSSRWWTVLKRRKSLARIKNGFMGERLLPNATIIISKDECDILKDQYGYDLNKGNLAYKLMENYFLIGFVIVDPALQRVKMLFDGRNEFEEMTFASLARENTVDDKKFKEMVSMLGRRI